MEPNSGQIDPLQRVSELWHQISQQSQNVIQTEQNDLIQKSSTNIKIEYPDENIEESAISLEGDSTLEQYIWPNFHEEKYHGYDDIASIGQEISTYPSFEEKSMPSDYKPWKRRKAKRQKAEGNMTHQEQVVCKIYFISKNE